MKRYAICRTSSDTAVNRPLMDFATIISTDIRKIPRTFSIRLRSIAHGQALVDIIMQVTRNAALFDLLRRQQLPRQRPQFFGFVAAPPDFTFWRRFGWHEETALFPFAPSISTSA